MSEGAITSAPARAWLSACLTSAAHRLVVDDALALHQAVVSMAGVRVERDVGDETELRKLLLDRAARPANEIALVERLAAVLVLQVGLGEGEERERRHAQFDGARGLPDRLVDADPFDARHRRHADARLFAVDEKKRPDQIVGRQHMFAHQSAAPFRLPVAARTMNEVEARGGAAGFVHGGVPPGLFYTKNRLGCASPPARFTIKTCITVATHFFC